MKLIPELIDHLPVSVGMVSAIDCLALAFDGLLRPEFGHTYTIEDNFIILPVVMKPWAAAKNVLS